MLQARLFGTGRGEAQQTAERLLETVGLDDVDPKKRAKAYSGGMTPAPRPGAGARPRPAHPVPRRAHDRPGPGEPGGDLGGGAAPQRRAGHDDLPHHAVPRRGGPARRPDRDHQPRAGSWRRARPTSSSARSATRWSSCAFADDAEAARADEALARRGPEPPGGEPRAAPLLRRAPPRTCPSWSAPSTPPACSRPGLPVEQPSLDDVFLRVTGEALDARRARRPAGARRGGRRAAAAERRARR